MIARVAVLVLSVIVSLATLGAGPVRPTRIGNLTESWGPTPGIVALRDGLVALGYRENADFEIGVRFTQGDAAALPAAARDLVAQGVDVIVVSSSHEAKAAQQATTTVPIVLVAGGDPVRSGLVKSLARPGGNITGISGHGPELGAKRLELFRDLVPGLKRVLFTYDARNSQSVAEATEYREAARRLGLMLIERPVTTPEQARAVVRSAHRGEVDGLLATEPVGLNIPALVIGMTSTFPTMFPNAFYVERGGLASYGSNYHDAGIRAARLVDKIIRGAKPATIPIESSSKLELVINMKVARSVGMTIPAEALYLADRIIR